ncbi:MAG TPA: hemolysin family protein [Pyrinomonadaceae bacterium]|nr:hemolysin family protein [Pyrinomonadaceae bacterium]
MLTVLYIVVVFLLVFANGFFVASEFALVGVRRSRIQTLADSGSISARRLLTLVDNLNAYISATQLGITMASLALGWIGEPVFAHILEAPLRGRVSDVTLHTISFTIAFAIITFLHIVLGELAPKTLALERAEKVALAISWPMQAFYRIFQWPIRLLDWAGTRTVRLFGLHPTQEHASVYSEEELRHLIDVSRKSGHLEPQEQELMYGVFEFSDAEVREAMVPRLQVEALPVTATLEETRTAFLSTGYSRLPVYGERFDEVVGLLFRKDLDMGRALAEAFDLGKLARPPVFVPATASLGQALKQMQTSRVHFCFVVDEHGGMEGILTLEDLLEEIVGEINDEYDEETRSQIRKEGEIYVLDGMLAVRDANQHLDLELPVDGSYTTIAGFLLARAGRLLKPGERVEDEAGIFEVERVDKRRISRVRFLPAAAKEKKSHKFVKPLTFLGVTSLAMKTAYSLEPLPLSICL